METAFMSNGPNLNLLGRHEPSICGEPFRQPSWLSPVGRALRVGFGVRGYALGIAGLALITPAGQK